VPAGCVVARAPRPPRAAAWGRPPASAALHGLSLSLSLPPFRRPSSPPCAELEELKARVESEWRVHMDSIAPFHELIDQSTGAATAALGEIIDAASFTPDYLAEHHGISAATIEALFACAKFRYECGEYDMAAELLKYYRELVPLESEASLRALWGKFVADIVAMHFETAHKDCEELRALIARAPGMSELASLQQRSWLLHWSLFVFCNLTKGGKDLLIEFFLLDSNLNAIQLNCPWLLRYLIAAILTSKKRQTLLSRQLLRIVTQESAAYSDPVRAPPAARGAPAAPSARSPPVPRRPLPAAPRPLLARALPRPQIIEFMLALLHRFDFEAAQEKLAQCSAVIATDYFLSSLTSAAEFMENARRFLFETYCRIHRKIGLDTLASKLHMSEPDAEKWLIELMRSAQLDAKIDSIERQVVMSVAPPSVYQAVLDKTRDLTVRTRVLSESIETETGTSRGQRYREQY